ncbi:S8/S53 family peptidase [Ktedonobacteria bacterium brp13]|nr:S8/S53 family peptidase [Ktedonobacteria bacterium brp13]
MSLSSTEVMGTPTEVFHWMPGEMVVVIRLARIPADDALDILVEQVRVQLNTFLAHYAFSLDLYGSGGRWLENVGMPPIRRRAFIFGLRRKQPLAVLFFHVRRLEEQSRTQKGQGRQATQDDPLPIALSYIHGHLEYFAQHGLHIVSAMPNWLVTAAPLFYAQGGAVIPPVPAPSLDAVVPSDRLSGWHLYFPSPGFSLKESTIAGVQVVVLDTAHHPDRILSAVTRPELRRNWLLRRLADDLRQEDGAFTIEYDRYPPANDVCTGRDSRYVPRYYLMPDHGLSVVGIIRNLAPGARIRLVRVLNDYGGGDLYGLYAALTDLEHELHTGALRSVIINLSLTIMPDIQRLPYIWFTDRQWPNSRLMGAVRVLRHIEEGLRQLFECLSEQGALIVAAAGNDSLFAHQHSAAPRPPRAPARYSSTISVTSINSNFAPAAYANAANMGSQRSGIATFGGDEPRAIDHNGLPDAVRGIYIAPTFPAGEANNSGWADWRGTSFATPMISALGAHLMAQGLPAAAIMARLADGSDTRSEATYGTPPEVPQLLANSIHVQQRFGV